ncbi:amidase family protein [Arthrobacter sulfonylureivorans]|uniref:Amidase family protein n=1 Tax=Arthrobacter sulfonylureivorans TaxID=2486855 RepID=A0ABY3WCC8_9MICC|nr:amidase family protein [Arthrobacter sulfonylureivorans]UNK47111.1 amidase family protein [Arthrobacter sulfonylureivorans]
MTSIVRSLSLAREDLDNAFISTIEEDLWIYQESVGQLAGIPFACKDNINTSALPTTGGTPALAKARPQFNHPVVERLQAAGATLIGKTNLHELAFGITSDNAGYGPVRNPHDPTRSAGGSSGGSAAAVASGIVPFALATDTGGSARIPASWCGVVGFRPSMKRWGSGNAVPLSASRDTLGVIARDVSWIAKVDAIVTAEPLGSGSEKPFRLGVPKQYLEGMSPEVEENWLKALQRIKTSGISIVPVSLTNVLVSQAGSGSDLVRYELRRDLPTYLMSLPVPISVEDVIDAIASKDVDNLVRSTFENPISEERYLECLSARRLSQQAYNHLFAAVSIDALIYPTCVLGPSPLGEDSAPLFPTVTQNTESGSFAGLPSISIPYPSRQQWPVGISLEALPYNDSQLLRLALHVEQVLNHSTV